MNPNNPQPSRADIEVRLTALLLGELPPAEAELLRWSISQDPELAKVHDRLKSTIGLVRAVTASPDGATTGTSAPLKMSEERRQKLLAHFKTIAPKEFAPVPVEQRQKFGWLMPLAAVLVVGVLLAAWLLPALSPAKRERMSSLGAYDLYTIEDGQSLSLTKSLKHDKRAEPAHAQEPATDVVMETNGVEVASAAPQPALPAATPIALPSLSVSDGAPPAPVNSQTFAAPASGLPSQNHFIDRYAFMAPNTEASGGIGGGGGGARFGGTAGKPAVIWGPGGIDSDKSVASDNVALALPPTTPAQGVGYSLAGPIETSPSAAPAWANSKNFAGGVTTFDDAKVELRAHIPDAGETIQLVAKEPKDNGVSLAETLNSNHGIILPPDSGGYAGALGGATTVVENGVIGQKLGLSDNFQTSDQNGNNGQLADGQNPTGVTERLFYRNRAPAATPPAGTRVPIQYAQSADIAAATRALADRGQQKEVTDLPSAPPTFPQTRTQQVEKEGVPQSASASLPVTPAGGQVVQQAVQTASLSGLVILAPLPPSSANPTGAFPGPPAAPRPPASVDRVVNADLAPPVQPEAAPVPQPEVATKDNAFSTFSLNVSDVSFKLAAASLEHNVYPQRGSIRSEEFINAFDYRDPEPPAGAPVGFAWERAGDPFAHNRDFLRFSIKTAAEGRAPGRPLNLVLLLDKSGSMERADRVAIIHEALRVLATQLGPHDTLSVITFARTARLYVDGVPGDQADDVFGKLSGITPEGGTNLEEAMNLAYQTALRHYLQDGVNRVVLMTDGAANLGDVDAQHFKQKVEANRKQGVALDCFGIGWEDYNDDLLELLASHGDGRYGFLNTPEEATSGFATQLAGALKVAAADVKVQVEFNPARVTAYRQIGYASHQLTKQQFRDNTVDAAVIGAAESGNALYTIQINPQGDGPVATVRVRFRVPGTSEVQEHSWLVPYTGTAVALDQASPAMRLAATAGIFAEWLTGSPATEDVELDQLLDYLKGVPEVYGTDPRPKQLEWMIRQAKNFAGKG